MKVAAVFRRPFIIGDARVNVHVCARECRVVCRSGSFLSATRRRAARGHDQDGHTVRRLQLAHARAPPGGHSY